MNSKQRVLAALNGELPDRVPNGELSIDFDTVEKIIGHETFLRAKAKCQLAFWAGRHDEVAESFLKDHIELHEKLDLDIVNFSVSAWHIPPETDDPPPRKINASTWEDKYGRVYKYSEIIQTIVCVKDPVMDAKTFTIADFEKDPPPPERDERSYAIIKGVINRFKHEKFICTPDGGEIGIVWLGGMERGALTLALDPGLVKAATAYRLKAQALADEIMIHPEADGALWGCDFGGATGPLISPAMFRDFFLAPNQTRVRRLHETYGLKILKHCCGNVNLLLDDFLAIGYDAYHAIQPTAGMDLRKVKQRIGHKMTLWGGVAVEHLVAGTPEDVRRDVRHAMQCAKPGGRFILGSSQAIAVGTKYDNYMAMLDEYRKLRDY